MTDVSDSEPHRSPILPRRAAGAPMSTASDVVHERDLEGRSGYSPAMEALLTLAGRIAAVDCNVVIIGESGVGKERLARFVHDRSRRARGAFVAVNCGAIPEALFESELFGHMRGAFTGALHDRPGLFEAADKGTLLLDEVGELSATLQVKLLRTIQEREVRRVGDNRVRKVDVRLIAATNRNLEHDVLERRFRLDLWYRLKVVELIIPPLRDRPEDLQRLAGTLLKRVAQQMQRPICGYTPEALDRMLRYPWPGNVRELENAIERACAMATHEWIGVDELPEAIRRHRPLAPPRDCVRPLREVEREYILAALHHNQGNKTRTAEQLRIAPATLFRRLRQYRVRG